MKLTKKKFMSKLGIAFLIRALMKKENHKPDKRKKKEFIIKLLCLMII